MAGDINNPRIWEGADLWTAPVGTASPDDLDESLTDIADWAAVGLLSEDGASEAREEDTTDHYAWGSRLVRTKRSRHKRTITVTALEDNPVVFELVNPGSSATTTGGVTTRAIRAPKSGKRAFVLELFDGDITRRRYMPSAEVTAVAETTLSETEMSAYELTITVYPGTDDVLYYDIDNDPQTAVSEDEVGDSVEDGV